MMPQWGHAAHADSTTRLHAFPLDGVSPLVLSAFDLIAILLVLTATFGWIDHRFIGLPHTIGLLAMNLVAFLVLIGIELAVPDIALYEDLSGLVRRVDFQNAVLNGMLAFLLFAGTLHVKVLSVLFLLIGLEVLVVRFSPDSA